MFAFGRADPWGSIEESHLPTHPPKNEENKLPPMPPEFQGWPFYPTPLVDTGYVMPEQADELTFGVWMNLADLRR